MKPLKTILNFALAVTMFSTIASEFDYTGYVPNCRTKDPGINECLQKFLQQAIPKSPKGISEFSIESLDPYFIPYILLQSPLGLTIELSNISYNGFSESILYKVEANIDKYYFEFYLRAPKTSYISHYKLSGKLFTLPVQGEGRSNFTIIDHQTLFKIEGESDKNKPDIMKVKQVTCVMKVKRIRSYFERPFKNNKELSDVVNQLMNDQWEELFNQFKPKLEEEMAKHVYQLSRKYFSHVPYKVIFPD